LQSKSTIDRRRSPLLRNARKQRILSANVS
jgi:hypothetical protein